MEHRTGENYLGPTFLFLFRLSTKVKSRLEMPKTTTIQSRSSKQLGDDNFESQIQPSQIYQYV